MMVTQLIVMIRNSAKKRDKKDRTKKKRIGVEGETIHPNPCIRNLNNNNYLKDIKIKEEMDEFSPDFIKEEKLEEQNWTEEVRTIFF